MYNFLYILVYQILVYLLLYSNPFAVVEFDYVDQKVLYKIPSICMFIIYF